MSKKDIKIVKEFLSDFATNLKNKYGKDIDFILLFGSAARGEWKRGLSDVDLIIQVKSKKEEINEYAQKIFWELDEKHQTQFKKVCSIAPKGKLITKLEKRVRLYVPFEVFEKGEVDWKNGKFIRKTTELGAQLILPRSMMFYKIKTEGKILYGRDIRKIIDVKPRAWDRAKALYVPQWLAIFSVFMSMFDPDYGLKRSTKAALYAVESSLFYLRRPAGKGIKKAISDLQKEFVGKKRIEYDVGTTFKFKIDIDYDFLPFLDYMVVSNALKLKYNWKAEVEKMTRRQKVKFCLMTSFFVFKLNIFTYIFERIF